jgi:ADP-ribose pyrophosphatase
VPVANDGRLLLVKQWRHPAAKVLTELPAGTLEAGEEPRLCAERELQEEAGFKPTTLTSLGGFFSAPGFCTEYLHLFVAEGLVESRLPGDIDEHIELYPVTLDEALALIEDGSICDAKSVAGILRYLAYKNKNKA